MALFKLSTQPRTLLGKKVKSFRAKGFIPAVLYGSARKEALPLLVDEKDFARIYAGAGESSLVSLSIGVKDVCNVLVHDVMRHPVTSRVLHADFYEVRMDEKIKTRVPLLFTGESPAVKNEGGMLVRAVQEIEVECLPQDLPHALEVSIISLAAFHTVLRVKDIPMPQGVVTRLDPEKVIALVEEPRSEAELAKLSEAVEEAAAVAEVKVIGEEERKKKEAEAASKESA